MIDLIKTAEMALRGFEKIYEGCGILKEEAKFKDQKDVRDLATAVRKDCNEYIKELRKSLANLRDQGAITYRTGYESGYMDASVASKREWVGLTDEERRGLREWQKIQEELGPVWAPMMLYLYEAIEAKLKEKNT